MTPSRVSQRVVADRAAIIADLVRALLRWVAKNPDKVREGI